MKQKRIGQDGLSHTERRRMAGVAASANLETPKMLLWVLEDNFPIEATHSELFIKECSRSLGTADRARF